MNQPRHADTFARSKAGKEGSTTRIRTKVHCYCERCDGKLVDPRTKEKHKLKYKLRNFSGNNNYQEVGPSIIEPSDADDNDAVEYDPLHADNDNDDADSNNIMDYHLLSEIAGSLSEVIEPSSERNYSFLIRKMPIHKSVKFQSVRKGKLSDRVLKNLISDDADDDQNRF